MLPEYKTKTNIGVGIGILFQIVGRVVSSMNDALALPGLLLMIVGLVFFIWGCMNYAQGKGYSMWLGLLGLLSCIGLVVLVLLPDRHK
jgi:hypothetical protein